MKTETTMRKMDSLMNLQLYIKNVNIHDYSPKMREEQRKTSLKYTEKHTLTSQKKKSLRPNKIHSNK